MITFRQHNRELIAYDEDIRLCGGDHRAEADLWAARHRTDEDFAVVLGLGSGFHIDALLRDNPSLQVAVIDCRAELVGAFRTRFPETEKRVEIHIISSTDELLTSEVIERVAMELPSVLCFAPSFGSQEALFQLFFATLTGRNKLGLLYFLHRFGVGPEDAPEIREYGSLLTIKDLGFIVDSSHAGHPMVSAARVLKELVI